MKLKQTFIKSFVPALLLTFLAAPTFAVTVGYSGTLTFISDPGGSVYSGASAGDTFSGHFTYGDSASDVTSLPEIEPEEASYPFSGLPFNASISNGTLSVSNTQLRLDIENDVLLDAGGASFLSALHGDTFTAGSLFDDWNINAWSADAMVDPDGVVGDGDDDFYTGGGIFFSIDVVSTDSDLYSGVGFQAFPPELGGNNFGRFRVVQRDTDGTLLFDATGELDSLTTVPLPAAAWLFMSALLGLGVKMKRRETRDAAQL